MKVKNRKEITNNKYICIRQNVGIYPPTLDLSFHKKMKQISNSLPSLMHIGNKFFPRQHLMIKKKWQETITSFLSKPHSKFPINFKLISKKPKKQLTAMFL